MYKKADEDKGNQEPEQIKKYPSEIELGVGRKVIARLMPDGKYEVDRDMGNEAGDGLPEGSYLRVKGNVDRLAGMCRTDGTLEIDGNAGHGVGYKMEGGETIVHGNADEAVGFEMTGGKLSIEGNVKGFSPTAFSEKNKGEIVWKGVSLWKDGGWTEAGEAAYNGVKIPMTGVDVKEQEAKTMERLKSELAKAQNDLETEISYRDGKHVDTLEFQEQETIVSSLKVKVEKLTALKAYVEEIIAELN